MKYKRLLAIILFALIMTACEVTDKPTDVDPTPTTKQEATPTNIPESTPTNTPEVTPEATPTSIPEAIEVNIENQEIYNKNGLKITATGFDADSFLGPEIKLLIENESENNVTIQTRNGYVNGYRMDLQLSCDVIAGKKANDGITILSDDLETSKVDTISEIEFSFYIFETDSWEDIAESEQIIVKTNMADQYTQTYDDTGEILYNKNGLKIVSKGLNSSILGTELLLYVENNSKENITIQADNVSINGFMVNVLMSADVMPNKRAMTNLTILTSEMESNGIKDINDINEFEASFNIFNTDTFDTIEETQPIEIKVK